MKSGNGSAGETGIFSSDYFRRDREGHLDILGRMDDKIRTKGERTGPKEMENIQSGIPGIAEAMVIDVPDGMVSQVIKVFFVSTSGEE